MKRRVFGGALALTLALASPCILSAGTTPRLGAAEQAGKGWPYPEPAQPGATGFSPDYSAFASDDERWDILVHILWRRAGAASQFDAKFFDDELAQFLGSLAPKDCERFQQPRGLTLALSQIHAKKIALPYREAATGCLLFEVKHQERSDLAAADCGAK